MMRYYYDNPLAAAWMCEHHGIKLISFGEKNSATQEYIHGSGEDVLDTHVEHCYRGKYYLTPDSLHLLEPREGDLVCKGGGHETIYVNAHSYPLPAEAKRLMKDYGHQIVMRNGVAFMWPKEEA